MNRRFTIDRGTVAYAAAFAGVLAVGFALRLPSLVEPRWYRDEGIFAAVALDVRHGGVLYGDAWDNKPPLIFYTYAGIQTLFGNGMFALHLVTSAVVLLTLAAVMTVAFRMYGRVQAVVAGGVFAFVMCTPVIEGNLALTETYMILPTTLAVLCVVCARDPGGRNRPWALAAAGIFIGIAASYKQVAVFDGLAIAVFIWMSDPRGVRGVSLLAAGFAAPQVAFAAYFLIVGALPDYWYAVVGSLPLYSGLGPDENPLLRFAGYLPALLVTAWLVQRRAEGGRVDALHLPPLWLAFAFAGATSSALPFPHYVQQAAPAFALTAAGFLLVAPRGNQERAMLGVAAALAVVLAAGQFGEARHRQQLSPSAYYRNYASYETGNRDYQQYERFFDGSGESARDIAHMIREDGAGTTVYAWSELPWLYATGNLGNPTPYYTSFLGELLPDAKPTVVRELAAEPPAYVVVSDNAYAPFGELEEFVARRYVLIEARNDWRLYRLASLTGRLAPKSDAASVGGG
ncbi:MAG: glycosyltransferase family 39 protein [Chloroflexi bacterium]|nr:glycosyltransferase family 39 protein [Chloroflexota bacterium]